MTPATNTHTELLAAGTVLIREDIILPGSLKVEMSPYSRGWRVVTVGPEPLGRTIQATGWNFFFTVCKLEGFALGTRKPETLDRAMRRILRKLQELHFNAVEIDTIEDRKALGLVTYISIAAHARHIQRSEQLESDEQRKTAQLQSGWAAG